MTIRICSGLYKGHLLKTPKGDKTRPTTSMLRQGLFNICQNSIEGSEFLDLFAGSGAMGIEALSRGADRVVFVERDKNAIECIKHNLLKVKVEDKSSVISKEAMEAIKFLSKKGFKFDLIYMDPPYEMDEKKVKLVFSLLKNEGLLKEEGILFLKHLRNSR